MKCQSPCPDAGKYAVCNSIDWKSCNILQGKAVTLSDGRRVDAFTKDKTPQQIRSEIIDSECDEHLRSYISKYASVQGTHLGEEEDGFDKYLSPMNDSTTDRYKSHSKKEGLG